MPPTIPTPSASAQFISGSPLVHRAAVLDNWVLYQQNQKIWTPRPSTLSAPMSSVMLSSPFVLLPAFAVLIVFVIFPRIPARRSQSLPPPPGPWPDPLIGNVRQMGSRDLKVLFEQWGKEHGPIVYASAFGKSLIILNSFRVAQELLQKRGSIYSGRPRFVTFSEMMGWGSVLSQLSGGPKFRKHRKIIQETMGTRAINEYSPLQKKATYTFLGDLGGTPTNFLDHINRFSASTVLGITYGYTPQDVNDEFIQLAHKATLESFRYGGPGSSICDLIPFLKYWPPWMPFSFYQKHAAYTKRIVEKLFSLPLEWTKAQLANGTHKSLASDLLSEMEDGKMIFGESLDYEDIKYISGAIYAAGYDTSAAALQTFLLAMTLNPDVYKKAQRVIDERIGDRLVEPSDRENLPYITCLVKEVLRWGVPVPLGVPHLLIEDDVYDGYFIPRGSSVFFNVWAMMRNEEVYPEPEVFNPDRFLHPSSTQAHEHVEAVWGFGRRVCPGRIFAEASLWLCIANFVATMDIKKADGDENVIPTATGFVSGAIRHPEPFMCSIAYRSEHARQLVTDAKMGSL